MDIGIISNDFVDSIHRRLFRIADWFFGLYCFVVRPRRRGVYIVVWWDGCVLLVQNSYRHELTLPSGGVKFREVPMRAASRELEEEVGIRPDADSLLPIGHFEIRHNHIDDEIFAYELRLTESPRISVDNREVVKYQFAALIEALEMKLSVVARQVLSRY